MAHDSPDSPPPRATNRFLLFAGVAGACALGVGAGLWARPGDIERDPHALHVAKAPEPPKPTGRLEIVVDERPAPVGQPIEVLPTTGAATSHPVFTLPPAPVEPEPIAPTRPPEGLVRVQAVTPPAPEPQAADREALKLAAQRAQARVEAARLETLKAEKLEKARLEKVRLAKAEKASAEKARLEKVKLEKVKLDKAERARAERQARAQAKTELAAEQKAAHAKQLKLAKAAKAKADAEALAESRRTITLARLKQALQRAVHHERAMAEAAKKAKTEQPPPRGEGPLRLASFRHNRCVSSDPGAAIVCADPSLASADKQLNRAYQQAEAAGVSPAQLKRQQDRWLAARSAAAREAPWAVHDVYLARIAELNDQARDARGGGY